MARHLGSRFLRPVAGYSQQAFERLAQRWDGRCPLVLDSACGTGESTAVLARRHPAALVIGIDQSAERLERGRRKLADTLPANALLLRADTTDLWALLAERGVTLAHHYLLYPNPWPKAEHLQRRWHGHPRWRELLALGGQLELRTNWQLYAQEFALALRQAGQVAALRPLVAEGTALTPFELKYAASGHPLWQVQATLDGGAPSHPSAARAGEPGRERAGDQAGKTPVDR
ncbi:tRNA (guanine(46)-N(7))-methyltransferase TrmB [Eleftheria terrae]|uniref:tRNA (guanine(46)-N(7))-methyltransferase TrmB n=1 Tax=Eleftheria terrae TaxID=1597781 RepID=UPI00263B245A|nr:methyltransferase domain-containing protein [Eleftheria terrae]WKB54269.1 methyltransferase domain-containing protein [Eleftheria terrae]